MSGRCLLPATLVLLLSSACGEDTFEPVRGRSVPMVIVANPDVDTLRLWESATLSVLPTDSLQPPPLSVLWVLLPAGDSVTADTLEYTPDRQGDWLIRAIARFADDAVGTDQRRFVTPGNAPPTAHIQPLTDDSLTRMPLGAAADLRVVYSDPDGDPISPQDIEWLREEGDDVEVLGTGETLHLEPDSVKRYRVAVRVSDPAGAFAIARYPIEVYDPLTPPTWRIHATTDRVTSISLTPGDRLLAHNGTKIDGGYGPCHDGCRVVGLDPSGERRWVYLTEPGGPPLATGSGGDAYFARRSEADPFHCSELVSLAPDGNENWVLAREPTGFGSLLSPAILHDGTLAVPSCDGSTGGGGGRWMRAVSPGGEELWRTQLDGLGRIEGLVIGSDTTLYAAGDNSLVALTSAGTILWSAPYGWSEVIVADDSTLLVSTPDSLYAVAADGSRRWAVDGPTRGNAVMGSAGTLYFAAASTLRALDLVDGSEAWRVTLDAGWYRGSPVLSADGRLFVGAESQLIAYDRATGVETWRHQLAGRVSAAPLITADGLLVVGDSYGYVEAFDIGSGPLDSPWPMAWADAQRTGRVRLP